MADRVYPLLFHERMLSVSPEWLLYHWPLTTDKTEEKLRGKPIHVAFVSAVPHWMVNPVELSRDLAKTKYGVIHTSVPQLIPSYADSRIVNPVNVRSIGLSKIRPLWNHGGMDNVKRSSKVGTWVLWNCPVDFSPNDSKSRGVITCLTKAENSKPWRPVVRPNRYGWIWIVANTVFIVFGWTTRVWNNCPLDRSNGRKTSWETNAASGVCINHHPRNCKSRGVITCFI